MSLPISLNTDNIFKFLLTGGLLMFIFSIIYPLDKRQKLEIEMNSCNEQVSIVNNEMNYISQRILKLDSTTNNYKDSIEYLRKSSRLNSKNTIRALKDTLNYKLDRIKYDIYLLEQKRTSVHWEKQKLAILQEHINEFNTYKDWILWSGIVFAIIGFCGWVYITYKGMSMP